MNLYNKRREELMKLLEGDSCAILFSGKAIMCSEDEAYPFKVNRNFYYLTGLERESMVLVLSKIRGVYKESLFILPFDEKLARWVGGRMSKKEASQISGIQTVLDYDTLDSTIASQMNMSRKIGGITYYFDLWHYEFEQTDTEAYRYLRKLTGMYPATQTKDLYPYLTQMRAIKDEYEIACMRRAIEITRCGVEAMMQNIEPDMNEMVMEGVFNFALAQNVCGENAFKTIAASGKRATVLHYSQNDQIMKDGELFLCDLGASYHHYCADISRTFPVNGHFTPRQAEIYSLVLGAMKLVEQNAKPGLTIRDLNNMVIDYYREELNKHGLYEDVSEYYFHSISHPLGLDTHDVDLGTELKPGMVITNEPGLYITSEGIGIRIEDDLYITDDGAVNLSKSIVREIEDIEALMRNR